MPYFMEIRVDGACTRNGTPEAKGAAAAIHIRKWDSRSYTQLLPNDPRPTSQRAELRALLLALELAQKQYNRLDTAPRMVLKIYSDSRYAVSCMKEWNLKWRNNGWTNAAGNPVANTDLIMAACDIEKDLKEHCRTRIKYIWVSRDENTAADQACKGALKAAEAAEAAEAAPYTYHCGYMNESSGSDW
jgi:ribonuclease HI